MSLNALVPEQRANSVTTILVEPPHDPAHIREVCRDEFSTALGGGLNKLNGKAFRIGHMGDQNVPMILGALAAVEAALGLLKVPHSANGVGAAIQQVVRHKGRDFADKLAAE